MKSNHLICHGEPLKIKLYLNQEKGLTFQDKMIVDLKGVLNADQLRVINNDKFLQIAGKAAMMKYLSDFL